MAVKPIDLTDWQARAIDRLSLLIEPLPVQPKTDRPSLMQSPAQVRFWDEWIDLPHAVGDRLWCREEWYSTHINPVEQNRNFYRADCDQMAEEMLSVEWQPADTMPQWASRFTLEVVAVTVKRLQEVTEDEALRSGVQKVPYQDCDGDPRLDGKAFTAYGYTAFPDRHPDPWSMPQCHKGAMLELDQPPWDDNPWCAFTEVRKV